MTQVRHIENEADASEMVGVGWVVTCVQVREETQEVPVAPLSGGQLRTYRRKYWLTPVFQGRIQFKLPRPQRQTDEEGLCCKPKYRANLLKYIYFIYFSTLPRLSLPSIFCASGTAEPRSGELSSQKFQVKT